MNSSIFGSSGQCDKDALTGFVGWMLQCMLAALAFSCLIGKRFCEPIHLRRSWETWWYDTSKQGIGALVIHMINVYLSPLFQGDPCTWYIINFLLDSTIGLFIIYIGIRICQLLAKRNKCDAINFGEYGAPKSWIYQTWIYVGLMIIVKIITTLLLQLNFWSSVKNMVLSPFSNPKVELAAVLFVIPFFVNMLIFWVTDNFLMRHTRNHRLNITAPEPTLFERVRVRYRALRKEKDNESESDIMVSEEDSDDVIFNSGNTSGGGGGGMQSAIMASTSGPSNKKTNQRNSVTSMA